MIEFILSLIAFVSLISLGFFYLGKRSAYNKVLKNISTFEIKNNKDNCTLGFSIGFYLGAILLFFFVGCCCNLRDEFIDKWRSNKIIEQVDYKYHRINGEQVVVDSTFNYIKNPNFEK